jgi:predicted CoA-binding protein
MQMNEPELIEKIFAEARTIAVVGLSNSPERASYNVAKYLQQHGYKIVPVNPKADTILGEMCFATLAEIPFPVDCVDVFRAPEAVPAIVDEVIQLGIRWLWLQDGVVDEASAARAEAAGIGVVMDRCMFRDHAAR